MVSSRDFESASVMLPAALAQRIHRILLREGKTSRPDFIREALDHYCQHKEVNQ